MQFIHAGASRLAMPSPVKMANPKPARLRILHILGQISPAVGGPANVVVRLAAAQASQGHQVSIISSLAPADRASFDASVAKVPGFEKVHLMVGPWTTPSRRWFGMRLRPLYRSTFAFTDVLHIHGVWEPMLLVAASIARKMDLPYVVRPCGMLDPWNLEYKAWKKRLALSLAHRRMLNGAAFLQVLNADEQRLLVPLGLTPPQRVIPNAVFVDEAEDRSGMAAFAAAAPGVQGKPYVLFLGRLHHKKGLDILAESFASVAKRFPDVQLVVAGPDGGALADFNTRIDRHELRGRVHVVPPLYGPAKFAAMSQATCFYLPSRQEGFSLAVTEAMAAGTPVAISTECHFPQVAERGAGEVFPLSVEAGAAALERLLGRTPAERRRMGEAGQRLVRENFTWSRVAELTLEAYASVCGEPATAHC